MTLEEFRQQLKSMTTEELIQLHKEVRRNRRAPINKSPANRRKRKPAKSLTSLLSSMSPEDKEELIKMLEGGDE